MNVGIVSTWFERGAAYVSKQYKEVLEGGGHKVYIFARGGEHYAIDDPRWDGPHVHWAKRIAPPGSTEFLLQEFEDWLTARQIDLVFFNEQHWWPPVLMCHQAGIKTGAYIDYYKENTIPYFRLYDFLICNTRRHLEAFDWHPQAHYVAWGTNIDLFSPDGYHAVNEEHTTFFHSAGMSPKYRKGTDLLLKAFHQLQSPDARLIIHTQASLNEHLPECKSIIAELMEKDRLEIINKTVPAPGLYHLADVYVYPTKLEGIGLTIAEAISCGLPIIVPDFPPMNEFVSVDSGLTVSVGKIYSRPDGYFWPQCEVSIDALAESMQFYIDKRKDLPAYKKRAREYALSHLDWNKNARSIPPIFESVKLIAHKNIPKDIKVEQSIPRGKLFVKTASLLNKVSAKLENRLWSKRY